MGGVTRIEGGLGGPPPPQPPPPPGHPPPHLQACGHEALEHVTERPLQQRWRVAWDEEQHTHRVHVGVRGCTTRHLAGGTHSSRAAGGWEAGV